MQLKEVFTKPLTLAVGWWAESIIGYCRQRCQVCNEENMQILIVELLHVLI